MSFAGISAALENGRLPHGLLFLGPVGSGQIETARELAKALFCGKKKSTSGCGVCADCRLVDAGNHPDFRVFAPGEDSRTLKIEEVRQMLTQANLKPFQAPAKLFVIDPAEALSDVSQNALLKTLEEPPAQTYFVLIAHAAEKLLATVRSRLQTVHFRPPAQPAPAEAELREAERSVMDFLNSSANTPDLSALSREQVLRVLEAVIGNLRQALLAAVNAGGPRQEWIERIETVADFKEKISQNVNTKLALAVLWEELDRCKSSI